MNPRRTATLLLATTAILIMAAGCTSEPTDKDTPLPTRTFADVAQQAEANAKTITDAAGTDMLRWFANPGPCTGRNRETADDGRWYLDAGFNLGTGDEQAATVARIKTALQNNGWEIKQESSFTNDTGGKLTAYHPTSQQTMDLSPSKNPDQFTVYLDSTCFMPAPGENPLNN